MDLAISWWIWRSADGFSDQLTAWPTRRRGWDDRSRSRWGWRSLSLRPPSCSSSRRRIPEYSYLINRLKLTASLVHCNGSGSAVPVPLFLAYWIRIHWYDVRIRIQLWILLSLSKNSLKNLDSYFFVTSFWPFIFEKWYKCRFRKYTQENLEKK